MTFLRTPISLSRTKKRYGTTWENPVSGENGALLTCACSWDKVDGSPNRLGWDSDPKRIFSANFGFIAVKIMVLQCTFILA